MACSTKMASILLAAAVSAALSTGLAGQAPFEVGQQWTYRHAGPRPGSIEPTAIDGQRVAQVVGNDPNSGLWFIQERYTNDDKTAGRFHVDPNKMLVAIEVESTTGQPALLRYDPPIPYEKPDLEIGQKTTIETTLRMESPAIIIPMKLEIERFTDETVETDAGTFEACQHYKTISQSTLDIKIGKIPVVEVRHRWYHPKVDGFVRETYHKDPVRFLTWSRPAYDASSVLTAFGIEPVSQQTKTALAPDPNTSQSASSATSPRGQPSQSGITKLALMVVAVIFGMVGFIAVHRLVMNRHRKV